MAKAPAKAKAAAPADKPKRSAAIIGGEVPKSPDFAPKAEESAEPGFPSWRYGPDGQARVFHKEADVPEGWADHPSAFPPAGEEPLDL